MGAPRGARIVAPQHVCPEPILTAEQGLRVLNLALHGLDWRARGESLDSEDVKREVGALLALVYDVQHALTRENGGE